MDIVSKDIVGMKFTVFVQGDHYFSAGVSNFGKINCLHAKITEKNYQQKNFLKKIGLHNIGNARKSFLS